MIWTDGWINASQEGPTYNHFSIEEHHATRVEILWRYRLRLARLESAALRERLDEERLVADAVIRSMHMRIDRDEPIVRLATGLTFHPPGSFAHSQHLLELAALVEERRRHQRAPDSQEETPR